jgi:hypothetical protein
MIAIVRELRPVANEEPEFVRPLGCAEHLFNLYAQIFPVHFCLCAEIAGSVAPDALRSALSRVRERHPILRATVLADRLYGAAFYASDLPMELNTIPVGNHLDWRPTVEHELAKPMPLGATAPMRVTALHAAERTAIILTFHHAVADGLSSVAVLHDLMRALAGEPLSALPFPPVVEERVLGWSAPVAREMDRIVGAPPPLPMRAGIGKPNIAAMEFSLDETARLCERCRIGGTTMYGAVAAAAARHLPLSEGGVVRIVCPMDLRRSIGIDDGMCGVFIGVHMIELPAGSPEPIWDDAARIVQEIARSRSPEAVHASVGRIAADFPPTTTKETMRAFFSTMPQSSLVMSNLGVLPIAERYGPYPVAAVWGPAMLTNLPADRQTIGTATFAGRLRLVHQSYQPIEGLLMAIRDTLLASCA